jgi:N-acetylglutamate synthase-like GNAT family acetyltransferase
LLLLDKGGVKIVDDFKIIDLNPENIADYGVCGYKDINKHLELRKKIEWFKRYYTKGLRIKAVIAEKGGYQGMLEYIPGEHAHRPVDADGYMFIHCVFVGFKKEHKGKGYATSLIEECIREAARSKMKGVAVVTRKGSFMADDDIFEKLGFEVVDKAEPDFHLMVKKFNLDTENPRFRKDMKQNLEKYKKGLTILRSPQCPYTEKNVNSIIQSARDMFSLDTKLIDLLDADSAKNSPCPFGTFCIIYEGKIISHHPISNTRFVNIMQKLAGSSRSK